MNPGGKSGPMKYVCPLCGEVYDEERWDVPFAELPENWACPLCYAPKNSFVLESNEMTSGHEIRPSGA